MGTPDCYIKFLKSGHGEGFTATIREDLGGSIYNWKNWYGHLKGVVSNFEPQTEWEAIVKFRLKQQGVEFV